jgi:2-dehydropantoate 2-reductase
MIAANEKSSDTAAVSSVAVVGAGAMGCLFGALLSKNSVSVVFKEPNQPKRKALVENGLELVDGDQRTSFHVSVVTPEADTPNVDAAILCVKAYDTATAAGQLADTLEPHVPMLTLQNGLGNVEHLTEALGRHRVVAGTTSLGAHMPASSTVVYAGRGEVHLGALEKGASPHVETLTALFRKMGVEVTVAQSVTDILWSKLVVNVAINALTYVLGVSNGALGEIDEAQEIMRQVLCEAVEVACAEGALLDVEEATARVSRVVEATAENRSSMLMDRIRRRRTEIAHINGAVAQRARTHDLKAPVNETLTRLVLADEKARGLGKSLFIASN